MNWSIIKNYKDFIIIKSVNNFLSIFLKIIANLIIVFLSIFLLSKNIAELIFYQIAKIQLIDHVNDALSNSMDCPLYNWE